MRLRGWVVVIGVLAGGAFAARHAGTFLVVADPLPERADAIVVLAGSPPDRALAAADLHRTGLAPRVILTRERSRPEFDALAARGVPLQESHDLAIRLLVALGVPHEAITTLEPRTDSTIAEARLVAEWACGEGLASLVVVTSPSHTRRARAMFRHALGNRVTVHLHPATAAAFPAERWWRDRAAAKTVALEWQKLLAYWLVERWSLEPCERGPLSPRSPS